MHRISKKILQFFLRLERKFVYRRLKKEVDQLIFRTTGPENFLTKKVRHYPKSWGKGYQVIGEELYRDSEGRLRPLTELLDD